MSAPCNAEITDHSLKDMDWEVLQDLEVILEVNLHVFDQYMFTINVFPQP